MVSLSIPIHTQTGLNKRAEHRMAMYTAGIREGFSQGIAKLQRVLPSIEQAIPAGAKAQRGRIHQDITKTRRLCLSALETEDLVDWVEIEVATPEDGIPQAAYFDGQVLQFEDATTDLSNSMTDAQDALQWFYNILCMHWPLHCKDPHTAMLKLVTDRRNTSKDGGSAQLFEFDTLSSTHSKYWGRIRFHAKVPEIAPTEAPKVRFKESSDPEKGHQREISLPDFCQTIELSGNERICSIVDLAYGKHSETRGDGVVKNSKPVIPLQTLLQPNEAAGSSSERADSAPLTVHQKAEVAVVFACSLLQLSKDSWGNGSPHEGPWLQRNWRDRGICFLQNHHGKPKLNEPYLPIPINESHQQSTLQYPPPSFVALALTLLQLQHHEDGVIEEFNSIRSDIIAEDEGEVTDSTDYYALIGLLETGEFEKHVDDQYKRAIRACLTGRLVDAVGREEEGTVQQYFSRDIVIPLKDYLNTLQPSAESSVQQRNTEKVWSLLADSNGEKHHVDSRQARYADEWFSKFENHVHDLVKLGPKHDPKAPIKIAILDTGLEFPPEADVLYGDQIMDRRSWKYCDKRKCFEMEHGCKDSDGHGTHCVSVILKVAQNAHIYVARVFESRSQRIGEEKMINQATVKALTCAIDEWQVDIINMSFGCRDRVDEIDEVMKRAEEKGIIMIAAACNTGALNPVSWPARSDRVICVHAHDGYGNSADFTPDPRSHNQNFAAPGIAILGYWPKKLGMVERRMTGTSCAAPIVAGIVAVLLEFVRKHEPKCLEQDRKLLKRLRERQGIVSVLDKMHSGGTRSSYSFLMPWELLDAQSPHENDGYRMGAILKALKAVQ